MGRPSALSRRYSGETSECDLALNNFEESFMIMERGPGGRAPYSDFTGTSTDYFMKTSDEPTLRADYRESISMDESLFESRLKELKRAESRRIPFVYTSDHGELLGQRGCFDTTPRCGRNLCTQ